MTEEEFVRSAAARSGLSQDTIRESIAACALTAAEALATDDLVRVPGFVTLRARHQDERPARNPKTGEPCMVPAGIRISAKPAAAFLKSVDRAVPADD